MSIDDFLKSIGDSSQADKQRILSGLGDSMYTWLDAWGGIYSIPPDKRFGAFFTAVDLGYRLAKRDLENDRLDKLIK